MKTTKKSKTKVAARPCDEANLTKLNLALMTGFFGGTVCGFLLFGPKAVKERIFKSVRLTVDRKWMADFVTNWMSAQAARAAPTVDAVFDDEPGSRRKNGSTGKTAKKTKRAKRQDGRLPF